MQMFYYSVDVISKFVYFRVLMTHCMFTYLLDGGIIRRPDRQVAGSGKKIEKYPRRKGTLLLSVCIDKHSWHGIVYAYIF